MELPVVAVSLDEPPVCGLVLQADPFQTPRLKPTIWLEFGARPTIVTVTAPRLAVRSEEHTSELQSRPHLVCRLLLEKKNNNATGRLSYPKQKRMYEAY